MLAATASKNHILSPSCFPIFNSLLLGVLKSLEFLSRITLSLSSFAHLSGNKPMGTSNSGSCLDKYTSCRLNKVQLLRYKFNLPELPLDKTNNKWWDYGTDQPLLHLGSQIQLIKSESDSSFLVQILRIYIHFTLIGHVTIFHYIKMYCLLKMWKKTSWM